VVKSKSLSWCRLQAPARFLIRAMIPRYLTFRVRVGFAGGHNLGIGKNHYFARFSDARLMNSLRNLVSSAIPKTFRNDAIIESIV
jgi:hypothetical protein